jgi:predicted Zn-dependent protease
LADGRTAQPRDVTVAFDASGLVVAGVHVPWSELVADELGGDGVELRSKRLGKARLTVHSREIRDRLLPPHPRSSKRLMLLFLFALTLAGGVYAVYSQAPRLATVVVDRIPISWDAKIGAYVTSGVEEACFTYFERDKLEAFVNELVAVETAGHRYKLTIAQDDEVNAYAAPGGYLVVNSGLIAKVKSEDELAGVLAHEVEHVERRHGMRNIVASLAGTLGWQAIFGDLSGVLLIDPATMLALVRSAYSRDYEREADAGAARRLAALHIPVEPFASFFEDHSAPGQLSKALALLSTHPDDGERVERLRAAGRQAARRDRSARDSFDLKGLLCAKAP